MIESRSQAGHRRGMALSQSLAQSVVDRSPVGIPTGPFLNPGILFPSQRCRPHAFELASMESSILCSLLNTCWRCSAERCHTAVLVLASIASQTGSPRFSAKRASSAPLRMGRDYPVMPNNPPGTRKLSSISLVNECVGMKSSFENPHSASSVDNR